MKSEMAKNIITLILMISPLNCLTSLESPSIHLAEAYIKTDQAAKAEQIYRNLLEDPSISPWERSILTYNLGRALISQRRWEEALGLFEDVLDGKNISPLLKAHLKQNKVIAWLGLSHETKNIRIQYEILKNALEVLNEAQEDDCLIKKYEGYQNCSPSLELTALKASLLQTLDQLEKENKETEVLNRESPEGILVQAIKKQETAKELTLKNEQNQSMSLSEIQQEVSTAAAPFIKSVLAAQTTNYYLHKICQEKPWDRVIPLFQTGLLFSQIAQKKLQNGDLLNAPLYQKYALQNWRSALIALGMETTPSLESLKTQKESEDKIKKTVESLTEMDQMDRLPETKKNKPKYNLKPW
jgi:hypothetical protein